MKVIFINGIMFNCSDIMSIIPESCNCLPVITIHYKGIEPNRFLYLGGFSKQSSPEEAKALAVEYLKNIKSQDI